MPLAGGAFTFPEIALYKRQTDMGVAKFSATSYDAKEGTLIATASPAPSASTYQGTGAAVLHLVVGRLTSIGPKSNCLRARRVPIAR